MRKEVKVLAADVYDLLELSALAYGGIGSRTFWLEQGSSRPEDWAPCCIIGHAIRHRPGATGVVGSDFSLENALYAADIGIGTNDVAVARVNHRKGRVALDGRITFAEWCAELNVVRGPHPSPEE